MNYICVLLEVLIVFLIMIFSYKYMKKDGLYLYICLMSSILGIIIGCTIDILFFRVSIGVPIVMGIFICSTIIIQRYGLDEVKRILYTYGVSYFSTYIIINMASLVMFKSVNSDNVYSLLFGYNLDGLRSFIGGLISIIVMIWIGSGIYYSFRKSKNILLLSNFFTTMIISFIESIIFVLIVGVGNLDIMELFGMVSVRYITEIVIAIIGLIPVYILVKFIDK